MLLNAIQFLAIFPLLAIGCILILFAVGLALMPLNALVMASVSRHGTSRSEAAVAGVMSSALLVIPAIYVLIWLLGRPRPSIFIELANRVTLGLWLVGPVGGMAILLLMDLAILLGFDPHSNRVSAGLLLLPTAAVGVFSLRAWNSWKSRVLDPYSDFVRRSQDRYSRADGQNAFDIVPIAPYGQTIVWCGVTIVLIAVNVAGSLIGWRP